MKKILLILCVLMSISTLLANALLNNPSFDKPLDEELVVDSAEGVLGREVFTEHLTWNKCLELEVKKYLKDSNGKSKYYALVLLGGKSGTYGFPVKPNARYKFSIELRGDIPSDNLTFRSFELTGNDFWKDRKELKLAEKVVYTPSKDWVVYSGEFQTTADGKTAMFGFTIWGEDIYNNLPPIGSKIYIDKLKIEELADLFATSDRNLKSTVDIRRVLSPSQASNNFSDYKNQKQVATQTTLESTVTSNSIILDVICNEPEMKRLKANVNQDNADPWLDDVVELFFAPVVNDRKYTQLVVAAGGGRWMSYGAKSIDELDKWSAKVTKENDAWRVRFEVPFALLGWETPPEKGTPLLFNVGRQRAINNELSTWSKVQDSFGDVNKFGVMLLGTPEEWKSLTQKTLAKHIADLKASQQKSKIEQDFASWSIDLNNLEQMVAESSKWQTRIKQASLGDRIFSLVELSPTQDPTIPLVPLQLVNPNTEFKLQAAINDKRPLPLGLVNLTDKAEEYRLSIGNIDRVGMDRKGLLTKDGKLFPADKITLLRGIRMRDGEEENVSMRFDPMVEMDKSNTVIVPPKEAGLIWAIFDTNDVEAGIYTGVVRVSPLSGYGKLNRENMEYSGSTLDIPLSIEVLPFALDKSPAIPQFMFGEAFNEESFKQMVDYGVEQFLLNPWSIGCSFNLDGSIKTTNLEKAERKLSELNEWAKKYNIEDRIKIGVVYSVYPIFKNTWSNNQFKYGTKVWEKAWGNYLALIADLLKRHGFDYDDYFYEIWDEPHPKDMDELIVAAKFAKREFPEMRQMLVLAAWLIDKSELAKIADDITIWNFWMDRYLDNPEYKEFIDNLRKNGKSIAFYQCETSMRVDLQSYYRRHAWYALAHNLDMVSMFQWTDGPNGSTNASSWRSLLYGGVVYASFDTPISSLRLENLRLGNYDIRYMSALKKTINEAKSSGNNSTIVSEAEKFLQETPRVVGITRSHDGKEADLARNKAIEYILKLQQY